jgi:uncharacterized membrane protein
MNTNETPYHELIEHWRYDPANWYFFDMFYFNKADKRLLPPKKIKSFGWTVNFANPFSVLILVGVFVGIYFLRHSCR